MTQITNKMEVNFPSLGGVLRSMQTCPVAWLNQCSI